MGYDIYMYPSHFGYTPEKKKDVFVGVVKKTVQTDEKVLGFVSLLFL